MIIAFYKNFSSSPFIFVRLFIKITFPPDKLLKLLSIICLLTHSNCRGVTGGPGQTTPNADSVCLATLIGPTRAHAPTLAVQWTRIRAVGKEWASLYRLDVRNAGFAKFASEDFVAKVQVGNYLHSLCTSVTKKENVERNADSPGPNLTKWISVDVEWGSHVRRTVGSSPGVADTTESRQYSLKHCLIICLYFFKWHFTSS